jgi:hypothetical protein
VPSGVCLWRRWEDLCLVDGRVSGEQGDLVIGRGAGGQRPGGRCRGSDPDRRPRGLCRWMLVVCDRLRGSAAVPMWSREGPFFVWVRDQTRSVVRKLALKAHWCKGTWFVSVRRAPWVVRSGWGRGDRRSGAWLQGGRRLRWRLRRRFGGRFRRRGAAAWVERVAACERRLRRVLDPDKGGSRLCLIRVGAARCALARCA